MSEARNLRNMTMAQTPLLGEENTPMHEGPGGGTGFEGATPRHQAAFTPNPLATPFRNGISDVGATPRGEMSMIAGTPLRTPLRDNLSINPEGFNAVADTPRLRANSAKGALRAGFMNLPKAENNFELVVPEDEEDGDVALAAMSLEDAAERDARIKKLQEIEEQKALARRSQAVKLGLPRPTNVDPEVLLKRLDVTDDAAERLINAEVVQLLLHDSIAHPLPGTSRPGGTRSTYTMPADEDLDNAKQAINEELASLVGFPNANPERLREGLLTLAKAEPLEDETSSWASLRQQLTFNAGSREWVDPSSLTEEERIEGYNAILTEARETMSKEAAKAAKMEKKLGVQLGGYQTRFSALAKRVTDAFTELQTTQIDYESFSRLSLNEGIAGPRRVEALKEEVDKLAKRENGLQERYKELDGERREAAARVALLEEKMMAEAEAMNEAALAEMEA